MIVYACDQYTLPLPEGHRFPMEKYERLRRRVVDEGIVGPDEVVIPQAATDAELGRVHAADYVGRVTGGRLTPAEVREIGFPWSPALVERSRRSVGATIEACRVALERGVAVNLAGGTHHAHPARGAGFCVFNDAATAARAMQAEGLARRVVVLDCDVHQGDGTAAIFAGDPTVFTFSIHGSKNYPLRKVASDLDVELEDGTDDGGYLEALSDGLDLALDRARPDLAIYLAGADPYEGDRLGRLKVSRAGLEARDRLVFGRCRGLGLPVAVAMAGGYARDVADTVAIHAATVRQAAALARG